MICHDCCDMVNDSIGEVAFAARGYAPLSEATVLLSMSTTIMIAKYEICRLLDR